MENRVQGWGRVVQTVQGLISLCKNFGFYSAEFCQNSPKSPTLNPRQVSQASAWLRSQRAKSRVRDGFTEEGLEG